MDFIMVRPLVAAVVVLVAACGRGPIYNLSLSWRGVDAVITPYPAVAQAFATVPIGFGLRDVRPDPTVVGLHEKNGFVVRTRDNVGQYCSDRFGDLLRQAGARLDEPPMAMVEAELLEYRVDEGGTFKGLVRVRVIVRRPGSPDWVADYEGTSKRWGRTHSPDNFNEALSNGLAEVVTKLVRDDGFARALLPAGPPPPGG
jgi:hypothetical protein